MSDTSTNQFSGRGDNAARAAFTPNPGTPTPTPAQGYTFWDTDDQALYAYDFGLADWVAVGSGGNVNTGSTLTADQVIIGAGGTDVDVLPAGTNGDVLTMVSGAPAWSAAAGGGKVAQIVNTQTGAVATGSTGIPFDDSIPQNTEGDEYMTLAITPTSATNKLRIEVEFACTNSSSVFQILALFQDSTANALAAAWSWWSAGTAGETLRLVHTMTAGTTSSTTFKVRSGGNVGGTTTFNGQSGGRIFGGVSASSITITEYVP